jgi:hypothetical protein
MRAIINPRKPPKTKPNKRSTTLRGVACINKRTNLLKSAQTISTPTKVSKKVAEEFNPPPAVPIGTWGASSGLNQ